ncbi:MAG: hypothetical protein PHP45_05895 [Elusimicrobiales bacterium]|nr:hypothetical protein [Elusimicrobiales bacterium]
MSDLSATLRGTDLTAEITAAPASAPVTRPLAIAAAPQYYEDLTPLDIPAGKSIKEFCALVENVDNLPLRDPTQNGDLKLINPAAVVIPVFKKITKATWDRYSVFERQGSFMTKWGQPCPIVFYPSGHSGAWNSNIYESGPAYHDGKVLWSNDLAYALTNERWYSLEAQQERLAEAARLQAEFDQHNDTGLFGTSLFGGYHGSLTLGAILTGLAPVAAIATAGILSGLAAAPIAASAAQGGAGLGLGFESMAANAAAGLGAAAPASLAAGAGLATAETTSLLAATSGAGLVAGAASSGSLGLGLESLSANAAAASGAAAPASLSAGAGLASSETTSLLAATSGSGIAAGAAGGASGLTGLISTETGKLAAVGAATAGAAAKDEIKKVLTGAGDSGTSPASAPSPEPSGTGQLIGWALAAFAAKLLIFS